MDIACVPDPEPRTNSNAKRIDKAVSPTFLNTYLQDKTVRYPNILKIS